MYFLFILNLLLILHQSIQVYGPRCTCAKYSQKICEMVPACSWNEKSCGDLICKNLSFQRCTGTSTIFKCKWDSTSKICNDYNYKCEDLDELYCERSDIHKLNCDWTKNLKCENLDCSSLGKDCPFKCAYINSICSNPIAQKIDCASLALDQCNQGNGIDQICWKNDYLQCQSYENPLTCSKFSDIKAFCLAAQCIYENNQCRNPKCEEQMSKETCYNIKDEKSNIITLCSWQNEKCSEIKQQDLNNFSAQQCLFETELLYYWTEQSKCEYCQENPSQTSTSNTTNTNNTTNTTNTTDTSNTNTTNTYPDNPNNTTNFTNTTNTNTNTSNPQSSTNHTFPNPNTSINPDTNTTKPDSNSTTKPETFQPNLAQPDKNLKYNGQQSENSFGAGIGIGLAIGLGVLLIVSGIVFGAYKNKKCCFATAKRDLTAYQPKQTPEALSDQ